MELVKLVDMSLPTDIGLVDDDFAWSTLLGSPPCISVSKSSFETGSSIVIIPGRATVQNPQDLLNKRC